MIVFSSSRPSIGVARKEEGDNARAFNQIGTKPPGRWDNADRRTATAPQSKPVTPASRLVAHAVPLVAFGLGLRILAAGPAALPTVLRLRAAVRANPNIRRNRDETGKLARGECPSSQTRPVMRLDKEYGRW